MECSRCGSPAVIEREYEGRALCGDHFSHSVEKQVKETIRENDLIQEDNTVAVGLSGGKDSGVLLKILHDTFGERPDVEIEAVVVDEGIEPYRTESVEKARKLCGDLGVPVHVTSFEDEYGVTMDGIAEEDRDLHNCAFCGVLRRDALNREVRDIGADKLAIGHNMDDEVQTFMMNFLRGEPEKMARMGSKTYKVPSDRFVRRIKPLRKVREREVALYAKVNDLEVHIETCPHAEGALRKKVREFLNELEGESPGMKNTALSTVDDLLPVLRDEFYGDTSEVSPCEECGEPTSRDVCRKCELLERVEE